MTAHFPRNEMPLRRSMSDRPMRVRAKARYSTGTLPGSRTVAACVVAVVVGWVAGGRSGRRPGLPAGWDAGADVAEPTEIGAAAIMGAATDCVPLGSARIGSPGGIGASLAPVMMSLSAVSA